MFLVIRAKELKNNIGKYLEIYSGEKIVARLDEVREDEGKIVYTVIEGDGKGSRFSSKYDKNGMDIKLYTKGQWEAIKS